METITLNINNADPQYYLTNMLQDHGYDGLIPTNMIINKRRPAIGATHCELHSLRHSILIEPYITVIEVKKQKLGDKICAVIEDFKIDDITAYLNDDNIAYKKIVTTPESFRKVIRALKKHDPLYRKHYFLLIDECEKLIQHAQFRNKIFGPIEEFFLFSNKALISATPLTPSHVQFAEQGFKKLDIKPTFDYKKDIKLIATNNIRASLRNTIKLLKLKKDGKPVFLFTNCKRTILYFTRLEQVKDSFKVFCAEDLDQKFFSKNLTPNVEFSVRAQSYASYNAFTSRFFAAVDMHPKKSAHVIIVTNLPYVHHSIVDPNTEAIQIFGRDRNTASSIIHITNFFPKELISQDVETEKELYFIERLQSLAERAPNGIIQEFIKRQIDKELAAQALKPDGAIEPFLKDHYELNKSVKQLYYSKETLLKAYTESTFFTPKMVNVQHTLTGADELKLARSGNGIKKNKEFINQLHKLLTQFDVYNEEEHEFIYQLNRLQEEDIFLFNAYREIGYEAIANLGYSKKRIKEAIFTLKQADTSNYFLMIDKIISSFKLNIKINITDIVETLQRIYNEFNYEKTAGVIHHAKGTDIKKYFKCKSFNGKTKVDNVYITYYRLYEPLDKIASELKYMVA